MGGAETDTSTDCGFWVVPVTGSQAPAWKFT